MVRRYGEDPNSPAPRDQVQSKGSGRAPTAQEVQTIHRNSDVDARADSQHHTLGYTGTQAAPGDHNHRDGRSIAILDGITITGSKSGTNAAVLGSIVAALAALGASDGTT